MEGGNLCGNMLVDEGEECDCGTMVDSNGICMSDQCCNGTNCTLNANIQCRYVCLAMTLTDMMHGAWKKGVLIHV